ncbi:MAG: PQQ-binding-like beta-propeller repeat protein [Planctomycetes bacterium]|nr:PQQ-binding-like beta-propeller repeat protein [Planctomycetota bacterium]
MTTMNVNRIQKCALIATLVLITSTLNAAEADWPWFLGANHNDTSSETGLARSWPEAGPRVLWTLPLGEGYGGAAVRDGKVHILDRVENQRDILRVHDLETGREAWTFSYDAPGKLSFNGSRSVPAVTRRHIYTTGAFGDVYCLDRKTHEVVWKRHLVDDFEGGKLPMWGIGFSPYVYKGWILLSLTNSQAGLVALDRETGQTAWESPADPILKGNVGNYMTPRVLTLGGVDQVVLSSADEEDQQGQVSRGRIIGFSATDGHVLWTLKGLTGHIVQPIAAGPDRILMTSSYPANTMLLEVKQDNDAFNVRKIFEVPDCGSQLHVPILHQGHFYLNGNTNKKRDGLLCLSPSGKILWQTTNSRKLPTAREGLPKFDKGNMIMADGLFFIIDGAKGTLHLTEPSSHGYKELASAKLLDGKQIWAPMALSRGRLLIRDQGQIKCLDVKAP